MGRIEALHPVLASRDVVASMDFYRALGFACVFVDDSAAPAYAALRRDRVELHLQWTNAGQWAVGVDRPAYRFLVEDVDALHAEFAAALEPGAWSGPWAKPGDTPWGTREFHLRDPGGNVLQFYRPR